MKKEIINFLKKNIEENKYIYNGFSFVKKFDNNRKKIIHSMTVYKTIDGNIKISENDFAGIIYNNRNFKSAKSKLENGELKYLKFFFQDLLLFDNKKLFSKQLAEENNIEALFFYIPENGQTEDMEVDENEIINDLNLKDYINTISKKNMINKNIKIKAKKIVMIFDLKRPQNQYRNNKNYLQSHLTIDSTILFFLKKIATNSNFLVLNSTGDGFIFIYDGNNLRNDFNNFFKNFDEYLMPFIFFLNTIDDYYYQYAVRGIIKKCIIYELLSNEFYNDTVFISNELDWAFKDLDMCKKKEYQLAYYNFFLEKKLNLLKDSEKKLNKKNIQLDKSNCRPYIILYKRKT